MYKSILLYIVVFSCVLAILQATALNYQIRTLDEVKEVSAKVTNNNTKTYESLRELCNQIDCK